MSNNLLQTSLSGSNDFTDWYPLGEGSLPVFILTEGAWVGTLTCQMIYPGRTEPIDLPHERFTANFDIPAKSWPIGASIRVGFKTGEWVSGTAIIDITQ